MINVNNLSKKYKGNDFYSLKDVSFNIKKGEIVGLIGRNGAGKTTLLRMLVKATRPTNGSITYNDVNINSKSNILDDFGIMIKPVFYPELSVYDNLITYLQIHNKLSYKDNIQPTLELVDLWKSKDRKPQDFSFGMKQRVALAIALVTKPKVLILDEPFVGLDPVGVKELLKILKQWAEQNQVSMIVSSHQLTELTDICDRYIFIKQGHLESEFDKEANILKIELSENNLTETDLSKINAKIKFANNTITVPSDLNETEINELLFTLSKDKLIKNISTTNDNLSDLF